MDAVNEIKARLNIEDVVGEYVQLKRAGRNFKGLSPWTNEKSPSFIVSPEKQIWHDFSSGKGGDMFSFVMELEGMEFRAALEHLARKAGVDLEQLKGSSSQASQYKARALEALELATKFYQKQLPANPPALNYLIKDRKFNKKTLLDWRLGYAPNTGYALSDFLTKKGFEVSEMKGAGLVVQRHSGNSDMFRGRIMIPLCDSRGTVIGFTARLLHDEPNAPKYINTPSTPVYDKSRHVFGLHLAKEPMRKEGFVVVAEGNLDVIASHQIGVAGVVATAGTAITEQHLRELKRFTGDIRLCFDADRAGTEATERAIPLAQKTGVSLSIINLPEGKDPDELIQKDPKAWQKTIKQAKYAPDWLIERYEKLLDLTTGPGKKAFTDSLLGVIRRFSDPVEQEHYLKKVAEAAGTSLEAVKSKLQAGAEKNQVPRRQLSTQPKTVRRDELEQQKLQDHLLAMTLMQPKIRQLLDDVEPEYLTSGPARTVLAFLKKHPEFKGELAVAKELQEVTDYVKITALQFEELYNELPLQDLKAQAINLKRRLIKRFVKMQKHQLAEAMSQTTDEQELHKLSSKADKLNKLIDTSGE